MPFAVQVGALQQSDLRNYIARWERPDASVFGVAGDATLIACTLQSSDNCMRVDSMLMCRRGHGQRQTSHYKAL